MRRASLAASCVALAGLAACEQEPEPRAQLLIVVDTDLPTVEQASRDDALSRAGSIDTLRIDVFKTDLTPIDSLIIVAPSPEDWPVSFGIQGGEIERVLVQARVFRSDLATPDGDNLVPEPALTVDRIVDVAVPSEGVEVVGVTLDAACLGIRPSFAPVVSSCASADELSQPAAEAAETGSEILKRPTLVGTAPLTRAVACSGASPEGAVCIPGGFTHLGEATLIGISDGFAIAHDPVPLVPVRLSPFHLDATEFTVGRARALLAASPDLLDADDLVERDPANGLFAACTWLGVDDPTNDDQPLACVSFEGAQRLCRAVGGDLPSEARWEFAARGRGQQRAFAWGQDVPTCCHGRFKSCVAEAAPVGTSGCGEENDTTLDGIADMTGNLSELTLDTYVGYDAPCWKQQGVLVDPVCVDGSVESNTWRGSDFKTSTALAHLAIRKQGLNGATLDYIGFRCAYDDSL